MLPRLMVTVPGSPTAVHVTEPGGGALCVPLHTSSRGSAARCDHDTLTQRCRESTVRARPAFHPGPATAEMKHGVAGMVSAIKTCQEGGESKCTLRIIIFQETGRQAGWGEEAGFPKRPAVLGEGSSRPHCPGERARARPVGRGQDPALPVHGAS